MSISPPSIHMGWDIWSRIFNASVFVFLTFFAAYRVIVNTDKVITDPYILLDQMVGDFEGGADVFVVGCRLAVGALLRYLELAERMAPGSRL